VSQIRPKFVGRDGLAADDPLSAASPTARVDLDGIARLFTDPGLFGEFAPSSYWRDVQMVWRMQNATLTTPADVTANFASVVAELCDGHETVAVNVSGGLDSLAVLWHAVHLRPRRQVVAYTADLVDDIGDDASSVVRQLLTALDLHGQVEVVVVDPAQALIEPPWTPYGPRLEALPAVNATIAARAVEAGAGVVLSGNGADELCAMPNFGVRQIAARHGWRAGAQYVRDIRVTGLTSHLAGALSSWLPPSVRARLYWSAAWPQWCDPGVSPVVGPQFRDAALVWARSFVDTTIEEHARLRASWAEMDAHDAWWPRAFHPPAGNLAAGSPFCDDAVINAVAGLPLADRYSPALRTPYQRVKGLVVRLFPERLWPILPRTKRYYSHALAEAVAAPIPVPHAQALGLLDQTELDQCTCVATRMTAAAVEDWLAGIELRVPDR
jgi:asparagine synthase (glutamine-hydrolysing)